MRFWVVTIGEPLPGDPKTPRLHRSGFLAQTLADRRHEVTWFTSTFDHFNRRNRADCNETIELSSNYRIEMLYGPPYRKNISFSRIVHHKAVAKEFVQKIRALTPPHAIVVSMPTLELASAATEFGLCHGVKVFVDLRDMWPDIFLDLVPGSLQPIARFFLAPVFQKFSRTLKQTEGVWGITPEFVEWGRRLAGLSVRPWDRSFWLAYPDVELSESDQEKAKDYWGARGVHSTEDKFRICYFGALSNKLDRETVIEAARMLDCAAAPVQFVLCGNGDELKLWQQETKGLQNVVVPGWIGRSEIIWLMKHCHAGLMPIHNRRDFVISVPNKAIEYLAGALPIVSCLEGTLKRLIAKERVGVFFESGSPITLVDAIHNLRQSPSLLAEMSRNALRLFRAEFRAEVVYGRMADTLEQVASLSLERSRAQDAVLEGSLAGEALAPFPIPEANHRLNAPLPEHAV